LSSAKPFAAVLADAAVVDLLAVIGIAAISNAATPFLSL
jgi:hypothetical protein